jgi:hypothetical protein
VVSGEGSTPSLVALSSATILLLTAIAYVKNRLLATSSEPDRGSAQEGSYMGLAKAYFGVCIASFIEVGLALGTSHRAVVGPLAKAHCTFSVGAVDQRVGA